MLQDWVTVAGQSVLTTFVQGKTEWLDLQEHQDAIFWLEVRELNAGGGTVSMTYETSPLEDETYFMAMLSPFTITVSTSASRKS
jgi:hypothetical protein